MRNLLSTMCVESPGKGPHPSSKGVLWVCARLLCHHSGSGREELLVCTQGSAGRALTGVTHDFPAGRGCCPRGCGCYTEKRGLSVKRRLS